MARRLATALFCLAAACGGTGRAQNPAPAKTPDPRPAFPKALPGNGLAEHDFLYAGEAKDRRMYIVRKGRVAWSYDDPAGKGEISDAVLMSTGEVVLAHQYAVKKVGPDKKVLWNYDAPKGAEVHTAQPIGRDHVVLVQNGDPAVVRVVNVVTGATVKEFPIPVKNPKGVHGQFRHARLTPDGTLAVAHMDLGKVAEYDAAGKEVWSLPAPGVWGVTPLKTGNFLLAGRFGAREVNRKGEAVWAWAPADTPDYKMPNLQLAWRLPNGNTLVNNWVNPWSERIDRATAPVQAIELTPDRRVAWALRSWADPDLGPATTIQVLDEPGAPENVRFGDIK